MNQVSQRALVDAAKRFDYLSFCRRMFPLLHDGEALLEAEYLRLYAAKLNAVADGDIRRLIVNLPPRHLKTEFGTIYMAAYLLGRDPTLKIMAASYNMELARALVEQIRFLVMSAEFQGIFPGTRIAVGKEKAVGKDKDRADVFETTRGGSVKAVSFEKVPTGFGFDVLLVDDPINASDVQYGRRLEKCLRAFRAGLSTRNNDRRTGRIVVIMQRLANGDLSDELIKTGGYDVLSLPLVATEPEQICYSELGKTRMFRRSVGDPLNPVLDTPEAVEEWYRDLGDMAFAAQCQQRPLAAGTLMFKKHHLAECEVLPPKGHPRFMAFDTATSLSDRASYTSIVTGYVSEGRICIEDVVRVRVPPDEIGDLAVGLVRLHQPGVVLVEEANSAYIAYDRLRRLPGVQVIRIIPKGSKVERAMHCLSVFSELRVLLPKGAPWRKEFDDEFLNFPFGRHSDQVDATCMAIKWYLDNVSGERKDPGFRLVKPYLSRTPPEGTPPGSARIGGGCYPWGATPNLRPRSGGRGLRPPRRP